jgi:salicylate 5-hydroxylase small subunit
MRCDSRAMMGDRVHALRRANFYLPRQTRHLVGPARIRVTGIDRWTARSNYAVFETIAGESTTTLNVGVYDDVVIRDQDGEMRFERRWCVYDSELVPNSIVFPI